MPEFVRIEAEPDANTEKKFVAGYDCDGSFVLTEDGDKHRFVDGICVVPNQPIRRRRFFWTRGKGIAASVSEG
jgi:hypothetical protein